MFAFIAKSFVVVFFLTLAGLALLAGLTGATFLQVEYFTPWSHHRNTVVAEATNDTIWSEGTATTYTVEASVAVEGQTHSAALEMICARKIDTSNGSFKSGAMIWDYQHNFSRRYITIPVSDSFQIVFDARLDCGGLAKLGASHEIPFTPVSYDGVELRHVAEPRLLCWLPLPTVPFRFKSLEVRPLVVTSVKDQPVREVLSRAVYGPADRSLQRPEAGRDDYSQTRAASRDPRFYWLEEKMCWGPLGKGCSEEAMTYCAP